LLCLCEEPREIRLFDANTGMELGKLEDYTLTYPQAVLVLSSGGVVVSNGTHQGVHLFDGNLEYVQFIEILQATVIIGICEKDENNIYTLNYDYDITDCFILLTSLSGETTNKFDLTNLIEMGQMSSLGQFDGAAAMPMSNCRFITKYGQDIYVLDSGLDCCYVVNGDYGSLIPDEEDGSRQLLRKPSSLLFDSVGNMLVMDSEGAKVISKDKRLIGRVKVDHPLEPAMGARCVYLDSERRELYVSYHKTNTIQKYQL